MNSKGLGSHYRELIVQLLVICSSLLGSWANAVNLPQSCEALAAVRIPSLEEYAQQLEVVPAAEIKERMNGNEFQLVTMFRDHTGKLKPQFGGEFQSQRDNLEQGILMGGSGWEDRRIPVAIPLITKVQNGFASTLNALAQSLPEDLIARLQQQSFVTSPSSNASIESEYQLLMHTAPKRNGLVGGRTGILLRNHIPIVVRHRPSGKEFLVELKGVGSARGGYQKHTIERESSSKQTGGEWSVIGGVLEKQGIREDLNTNFFAFSVLGQPNNAVLSLGYQTFGTEFGRQAISLRLTPGNVRSTYIFDNRPHSPEMVSRIAQRMSTLMMKSMLAGKIPMTHPENFIAHEADPEVHMTDFSDDLPMSRFPVNWGFNFRDLRSAVVSSLASVEQIPGFKEKQNLSDMRTGIVAALQGTSHDSPELRAQLESAASIRAVYGVVYSQVIAKINVASEKQNGRLPPQLVEEAYFFKNFSYPYPVEEIGQEWIAYLRKGMDNSREFNRAIQELQSYPKPEKADSFRYFTNGIRDGVLLPIVAAAVLNGSLTMRDIHSPRLEEFFTERMIQGTQSDLVWDVAKKDLGTNKYADDLARALTMTPAMAAQFVREYLSNYSGPAPLVQKSLINYLEKEIEYLTSILPFSPHFAAQSLQIARQRVEYLKQLPLFEFAERYMQTPKDLYALHFLPYHQIAKLRQSEHMSDPNIQRILETQRE